jgi:uroporphyrinogen decarboxylase
MERLCDLALASLRSQLDAGASAVQVFDSWAGILTPRHYRELVLPATTPALRRAGRVPPRVPTILFGVGTGELLALMATAGSTVVGVDWRVPLDEARRRVGAGRRRAGQPRPRHVPDHLGGGRGRDPPRYWPGPAASPGHIFNLGHGVLPETDPAILERVAAWSTPRAGPAWRTRGE